MSEVSLHAGVVITYARYKYILTDHPRAPPYSKTLQIYSSFLLRLSGCVYNAYIVYKVFNEIKRADVLQIIEHNVVSFQKFAKLFNFFI